MKAEELVRQYKAGRRDFSEANLSGAYLREADLRWANLREANLRGASLYGANLSEADLSGANLRRANLRDTNLSGANLSEAYLREADLSGAKGLLDPAVWLQEQFESDAEGLIVYKAIGETYYAAPDHWTIEAGAVLEEVCNPTRTSDCACGVNFATRAWIQRNYANQDVTVWRCRIEWMDLAGVVVPYNTDGKARCARLRLLEKVQS